MFGFKKRNQDQIEQIINKIYQQLTIVDQPESYHITQVALNDLAQNQQAAPMIALKLADRLEMRPEYHYNLSPQVQALVSNLKQVAQKQVQSHNSEFGNRQLAYD